MRKPSETIIRAVKKLWKAIKSGRLSAQQAKVRVRRLSWTALDANDMRFVVGEMERFGEFINQMEKFDCATDIHNMLDDLEKAYGLNPPPANDEIQILEAVRRIERRKLGLGVA